MDKFWYISTMEYYSAINMNKLQIPHTEKSQKTLCEVNEARNKRINIILLI